MDIIQNRCWIFTQMNTRLRRMINGPDLRVGHIYRCSANFLGQIPAISIKAHAIGNFTWGQKISLHKFCKLQFGHMNLPHWATESCLVWNDLFGSCSSSYIATLLTMNNGPFCRQNFTNVMHIYGLQPCFLSSGFGFIGWTYCMSFLLLVFNGVKCIMLSVLQV